MKKSLRFAVFHRDLFACQYCGRTPPAVVLEPDHIVPVSGGGKDHIDNLITACFDCNRGKGARSLCEIPQPLAERAAQIAEKEGQLKAYKRLLAQRRKRENQDIDTLETAFRVYFPDLQFTDRFKEDIRRQFFPVLSIDIMEGAMHKACGRIHRNHGRRDESGDAIKYFCGICWNVIRDGGRKPWGGV